MALGHLIGIFMKNNENSGFVDSSLFGRWEDLDRMKWVVIDVGVILDTSASRSEIFFSTFFRSWVGDHSAIPQGAIRILTFLVRPWGGGAQPARVRANQQPAARDHS